MTPDEILAAELQRLRDAAAGHPVHADRLETLIRHFSSGWGPEEAAGEPGEGLPRRVARMMDDDVSRLYWWHEYPELRIRQPLRYPAHMQRVRQLEADRQRRERIEGGTA